MTPFLNKKNEIIRKLNIPAIMLMAMCQYTKFEAYHVDHRPRWRGGGVHDNQLISRELLFKDHMNPPQADAIKGAIITFKNLKGGHMSTDELHAEFDINFIENNQIKIETDGCSIVTEYFEDQDAKRSTMGPANIFFSAFAL